MNAVLRSLATAATAGICGMAVHTLLMKTRNAVGILPAFQPYDDLQRMLGAQFSGPAGAFIPYVTGAMFWGFVFGRIYTWLPGQSPFIKGLTYGFAAWLAMGRLFFPMAERGIFAIDLGLGLAPAALMLPMLLAYSVTMSFVYAVLTAR